MSPELAMEEFLKKCSSLQTFGVNPYTVTIGKNPTNVVIGASSTRILVFVQNQIVYNVPWSFISGIDYSGKLLVSEHFKIFTRLSCLLERIRYLI